MNLKKKKRNNLLYIIFFILFLFACSKKEEDIIVTIGEKKITSTQFKNDLEEYKSLYGNADSSNILALFISNLVEREILKSEAEKLKTDISKNEIESFLKENNLTEKHTKIAEISLLREKIAKLISKDLKADDNLVKEAIKNIPDVQPEKIIFYQIVTNKEDLAYKALDELKNGASFEDTAKKYSISPEGKKGGLIDYLNADEIPFELLNALRKLKEGEISKVIKSPLGFHILKLKEIIKSKRLSEEEKKLIAEKEALKELSGNMYADWLAKKRKEYGVKIEWEKIKSLKN
ncbi:MAG: peptidylprolyl isomerase [Proteobacteria bacterium]|nr:peptidylprolyl isomerase [Pseudomonadota bacterium]